MPRGGGRGVQIPDAVSEPEAEAWNCCAGSPPVARAQTAKPRTPRRELKEATTLCMIRPFRR